MSPADQRKHPVFRTAGHELKRKAAVSENCVLEPDRQNKEFLGTESRRLRYAQTSGRPRKSKAKQINPWLVQAASVLDMLTGCASLARAELWDDRFWNVLLLCGSICSPVHSWQRQAAGTCCAQPTHFRVLCCFRMRKPGCL